MTDLAAAGEREEELLEATAFAVLLHVAGEYTLCYRFGEQVTPGDSGFVHTAGTVVVAPAGTLPAPTWTGNLLNQRPAYGAW